MADIYSHWRDSALTPRFFVLDAKGFFVVVIWMFHPTWITFGAVVVVLAALAILNYYHISLIACFRLMRTALGGTRKIIIRRS